MATFAEVAHIVYDRLGLRSDDSNLTIDHIVFMCGIGRATLLKQYYKDSKRTMSLSNYQTLCINLEYHSDCLFGQAMRSVEKIPSTINNDFDSVHIYPLGDRFNNNKWVSVSQDRFNWVGTSKWSKDFVYFTRASDGYVYVKSANPDYKYLKGIRVEGIFEKPEEAAKLLCDNKCDCEDCITCTDPLEADFPLEESLLSALVDVVYSKLANDVYRPEDKTNDANDSLAKSGKE